MISQTRTPLRTARAGMVAAAHPIAALIGVEILRAGGQAADAAVAMSAALAVLEPHVGSLGGEVCAQFWDAAAGSLSVLSSAESSRSVLSAAGAASVPGAVDAWQTALETWGTLTAEAVLAPAIALAEDGFALSARQAARLHACEALWQAYPESASALVPDAPRPGAALYQPMLARTLRQIAGGGREAFYAGEFSDKLQAYFEAQGEEVTREALTAHHCAMTEPVRTSYRGAVVTEPAPGSLLGQTLRVLERFDLSTLDPEGPDAVPLLVESVQRAVAIRRDEGRRLTGGNSAATVLCVVDSQGNGVSWMQGMGQEFGSGRVVPGTGVLLGHRAAEPHTLAPWMIFRDDTLWAVGGSAGGAGQADIQAVTQLLDTLRSPQEALESPKWHSAADGSTLTVEDRLPLDTCYALRQHGHALTVLGPWAADGDAQIILLDPATGTLLGGSDPRIDGLALGY